MSSPTTETKILPKCPRTIDPNSGLTPGTGFVGPAPLKEINEIVEKNNH
jgi:hypothetical protein